MPCKKIILLSLLINVVLLCRCVDKNRHPAGKTVFRYNESAGISSLDPAFSRNQANIWAVNQIFNGLVQLDDHLNILPAIAHSWEISPDGLQYTFYLRNDVFFHDHPIFPNGKGRKVVASDFEYSFKRIVDPTVSSPGSWLFNHVKTDSNGNYAFHATNDSTFVITLKHVFPPFLGIMSMQYCSVVPHEIVNGYGKDFRSNPIGTGPFKFSYWKEGLKLVLLKNDCYFETENGQPLPYLDAISITFIVDKQTAFLEFIKGKLDFISGIDASYKDELLSLTGTLNPKYEHQINLSKSPYLNTEYLGFLVDPKLPKATESPLSNKLIRQAINYGFDREKMMLYLRNNIGIPGTAGFVPLGMPFFDKNKTKGYSYRPDLSRQLLNEAGYPNGKGLPPITITTNASYLDLCQYIQSELNELGFNIKIDVTPPGTLREMMARSDVNFFRGSWIADYPDAENYLSLFYSPNFAPQGPNYTHFTNENFDKLYKQSLKITNDTLRYNLYTQMDSIIMAEAPVVVLYYDEVLRFSRKNIIGLSNNSLNLLNLKRVKKTT